MTGLVRGLLNRNRAPLRLPFGSDLEIALYDRPGENLDDAALQKLVDEMKDVAREGQDGKPLPEYGALLGDRKDLARRVITVAYDRKSGKPVGFNALAYLPVAVGVRVVEVVHLGLVFVAVDWQKRHLPALLYGLSTFLLFFKTGLRPFWVSNVTQVPAIVGMTAVNYDRVYPTHKEGRQSFMHLVLARGIMRLHRDAFGVGDDAGFDEARQVITNAYTGGSDNLKKTFDEAPKHRDPRVNELCRTALDYDRGDDIFQLGVCNLRATLGFLRNKMPRGALPSLAFQTLALVVVGVLVPVIRWLVPAQTTAQTAAPVSVKEPRESPR